MANEILIEVLPEETKVAILEDKELVEIYTERTDVRRMTGNVYRGKVTRVLPGMQAAFVDIGYTRNAFLYVNDVVCGIHGNSCHSSMNEEDFDEDDTAIDCNDIDCNGIDCKAIDCKAIDYKRHNRINELLAPGQEITVQVVKGALGNKGPRVTTRLTLPGRYLVLVPNANYIKVSRKIENESERTRLKRIAKEIKPENVGLIVRTVAEGKDEEVFRNDMQYLLSLYDAICQRETKGCAPRCIHRDYSLFYRTIRDFFTPAVDKLVINDKEHYYSAIEYIEMISPSLKDRIEFFDKSKSLFDYYYINYRLQKSLSRKVWLKSGGYIIIDRTEALTVIDVNTGKYVGTDNLENTVLKTNMEAACEIGKQLRLRDIGGIIIIDFIDMDNIMHKKMIMDQLKSTLKRDRAKTKVIGMSDLGLIEMTRKKVGRDNFTVFLDECPYCGGTGKKPGNNCEYNNKEDIGKDAHSITRLKTGAETGA